MGADLIGYQTMYPEQFTIDEKKELNAFLDKIEKFLNTPKLGELVSKETSSEDPYLKQLNELIPHIPDEINGMGLFDDPEEIQDLIDTVLSNISSCRNFLDNPLVDGRDVAIREYKFRGRLFISVFAGEMSWGDEPDGIGYIIFKTLDQIGLLHQVEKLCLPSPDSNSVQFSKEE